MTEYAIVLGAAAALERIQQLTERLLAQPPAVLIGGGVVVLVTFYALFSRR
jgi:hypothetical protein